MPPSSGMVSSSIGLDTAIFQGIHEKNGFQVASSNDKLNYDRIISTVHDIKPVLKKFTYTLIVCGAP